MNLWKSGLAREVVIQQLLTSLGNAERVDKPYVHWFVEDCLPDDQADAILTLPFPAPSLDGQSGRRELHNATRKYFDTENQSQFACVADVAGALQDPRTIAQIQDMCGIDLGGTYLRIEYAQDVDSFWLEPHTDIGVKAFTFLLYLSQDPAHADLGTDIYDNEKHWVGRSTFKSGGGMIFVPSDITYHGFEPRQIVGVRKSLVINYVTNEWRAREQLAFPDAPVAG
jgi:hypothetical protein